MKSKTVKLNVFALFAFLIMVTGAYLGQFETNSTLWVVFVVVNIVLSQAITFFLPSGEFVGHGQNWSVGKWIARIGAVLLATLTAVSGHGIATAVIAAITPMIEIFIRVYGTDTSDQREIALKK